VALAKIVERGRECLVLACGLSGAARARLGLEIKARP